MNFALFPSHDRELMADFEERLTKRNFRGVTRLTLSELIQTRSGFNLSKVRTTFPLIETERNSFAVVLFNKMLFETLCARFTSLSLTNENLKRQLSEFSDKEKRRELVDLVEDESTPGLGSKEQRRRNKLVELSLAVKETLETKDESSEDEMSIVEEAAWCSIRKTFDIHYTLSQKNPKNYVAVSTADLINFLKTKPG